MTKRIVFLIIFALVAIIGYSALSGTSEICAYYAFNLPECK